jgi:threonine/homoserine/homoserine lactone efflux protein
MNQLKDILWSFLGLLLFLGCIIVTLYCGFYIFGYGAVLELLILDNFLQGIIRLLCGLVLIYYIWSLDKGLCWRGILYCYFKMI